MISEERRGCREAVLSPLHGCIPGSVRSGVPVNQKECCWQETLRPAQEGFKWKYENKRASAQHAPGRQACPRYGHPTRAGALESQRKQERHTSLDNPPSHSGTRCRREMSQRAEAGTWEGLSAMQGTCVSPREASL